MTDPQQESSKSSLRLEVLNLERSLADVSPADAYAAELMAELEDSRRLIAERNRQLEKQQAELGRALEAARSADAAKKAQSIFLANMSHEMRTPLGGIVGMCKILMEGELIAEQRSIAETVQTSADCLLDLVNDLLDLTKIEAGYLVMECLPFRPRDVIESAMEIVAPRAHAKGLEFVARPLLDLPEICLGDPTRLRQVLLNLFSNGIKFTDHGHVVVSAEVISEDEDAMMLRFSVEDTGIGMESEVCPRMFEAFSQADASTSRRFGGTGLGLAIARHLVGFMHGEIWVKSEPGKGSTFSFTVKVGKAASKEAPVWADALPSRQVWVVEKNPLTRETMARYFEAWGLQAIKCDEESPVADMARWNADAIVVLDENLPRVGEIVERIRLGGGETKILLLRAPGGGGRHAELRSKVDGVLKKPLRAAALYDAVREPANKLIAGPTKARARNGAASQGTKRDGRVLLAEDNPVNQRIALHVLQKLGIGEVEVAANGFEALEAALKTPFDLVLMDCQMPVMDGYEATRQLREKEVGLRRTPVIAVTAHAMVGDRERCLAAGMDDYVSKPFTTAFLQQVLERWLVPGRGEEAIDLERESIAKIR